MTTATIPPEKKVFRDGMLLEMQDREFEILEVILRAKKGAKEKPAGEKKPGPKKRGTEGGVETMPEPKDPAAASAAEEDKGTDPTDTAAYGGRVDGEESDKGDKEPDDDVDDMEIAISSEFPVKRWWGNEILDHSPEAVDLSRAKRGLSFLVDHDSRDVVGIIEKVRLDDDKKLRGNVRFSANAPAQAVKRDIEDGIRRFISVGYMVNEVVLEKQSDKEGDTYRATRWMPVEASSVAVPADPTVGHNRSEHRFFPVQIRSNTPASKPNLTEASMAIEVKEAQTAAAEIFRLGKRHGIDHEVLAKMVEEGITAEQASKRILQTIEERGAARPLAQPGSEEVERFTLTEREQSEYNLARGIMAMVTNRELSESGASHRYENCLELEISDALEKRSRGGSHGGLFVPWSIRHIVDKELSKKYPKLFEMDRSIHGRDFQVQTRAGLDSKTTAAGGALVYVEPGEFLKFLYNRLRVKELGARTIVGLRDNVAYPKQTGKATGSWVIENPGVDVADSALTLAQIPSAPHTYQSSTSYSRQLLAQAVLDVDTLVREDLSMDMAQAIDLVAIIGGGTSQPSGILSTAGVQLYNMIADTGNGGSPAWADMVNMTQLLEVANADQLGQGAFLSTPEIKGKLKTIARLGNTVGFPIWADDNTIDGYVARSTNNVPKNGTKGTGTLLHSIIRGVFETMIVSMWGNGFELVVDPYRLKKQGMIELTTFMLTDVTLTYPSAFVAAKYVVST
jgi:HK97 family phage major capsid protein